MPYKILVEGINNSGKDYVCDKLLADYEDIIHYVKFPNNQNIISQIKYLFSTLKEENKEDHPTILRAIHNLFDLDFRIKDPWTDSNHKPIWLVNRYSPSNVVYSKLHEAWEHYYEHGIGHEMFPFDVCFYLMVGKPEYSLYVNTFPANYSTIPTIRQKLTPDILFHDGQEHYDKCLMDQVTRNNIKVLEGVVALKDETYDHVKNWLVKNKILPTENE